MSKLQIPVSEKDHSAGPADAPVTLVEYGDFQCPSCLIASRVVDKLVHHFGSRLRFVFRNFPLVESHEFAMTAAEVADFAASKDKFWEMHHALYAHQDKLSPDLMLELAEKIGLDPDEVAAAVNDHRFAHRIMADFAGGERSGVHGTPTFFINGEQYTSAGDYAAIAAAIEAAGA